MMKRLLLLPLASLGIIAQTLMAQDLDLLDSVFRSEIDPAAAGQSFGWQSSVDGTWAAISAPFVDGQDGAVYLFRFSETPAPAWAFVKSIDLPPQPVNIIRFGANLDINGDWLAVTADFFGVHLYGRNVGGVDNWGFSRSIIEADTATRRDFDASPSVALLGSTLIVGAPQTDYAPFGAAQNQLGSVLVYEENAGGAGNWGRVQTLDIPPAQSVALAGFGQRVALQGNTLVVGSEDYLTQGLTGAGRAWVYEKVAGAWELSQTLNSDSPASNAFFGSDVDVFADTVVVGSRVGAGNLTPMTSNDGSVYVFSRNAGGANAWGMVEEIVASQPDSGGDFGRSLALAGRLLWVGAEDAAYLFGSNTGFWTEVDRNPAPAFTAPSNTLQFGYSADMQLSSDGTQILAVVGDQIAENAANVRVGAAFFYHYDDGLFSDSFED